MITLRFADERNPVTMFADASRVSTDEHNNLEIWGGADGEQLLYVCAAGQWLDTTITTGED